MAPAFDDSSLSVGTTMKIVVVRGVDIRYDFEAYLDIDWSVPLDHKCNANEMPTVNEKPDHNEKTNVDDNNRTEFLVDKELLQSVSPYFVALKNFREDSENMLVLEDVRPESFDLFRDWLYTGGRDWEKSYNGNIDVYMDAYALGRRLIIPRFQNFVMDEMRQYGSRYDINVIKLFKLQDLGFTQFDPITKYFIDTVAYRAVTTDFWSLAFPANLREQENQNDRDLESFLLPLIETIAEMTRQSQPFAGSIGYNGKGSELVKPSSDTANNYHIPLSNNTQATSLD